MSKYKSLTKLFRSLPEEQTKLRLPLATIDALVDGLPRSALEHRVWWANTPRGHANAWLDAGWRVDRVDLDSERVTFTRP